MDGDTRAAAGAAVEAELEAMLGGFGYPTIHSAVPGVVAFERLGIGDDHRMDWQAFARAVAERTGMGVLCVACCDWERVDDCDVEATFVAFDLPETPQDYRSDPHRNLITPVPVPGREARPAP